MVSKEIEKKIIKTIKKHSKIYKLDKYLKIMKIKILKAMPTNNRDIYDVYYTISFHVLNPLAWVFGIIPLFFIGTYEDGIKETWNGLKALKTDKYADTIRIN